MRCWRKSRLASVIVAVLLLWTAADLTNPGLCALDNEHDTVSASLGTVASASPELPMGNPTGPRPHVDDCFCCSHCVDLQLFAPVFAATMIESDSTPLVLPATYNFGASLYHPPLV